MTFFSMQFGQAAIWMVISTGLFLAVGSTIDVIPPAVHNFRFGQFEVKADKDGHLISDNVEHVKKLHEDQQNAAQFAQFYRSEIMPTARLTDFENIQLGGGNGPAKYSLIPESVDPQNRKLKDNQLKTIYTSDIKLVRRKADNRMLALKTVDMENLHPEDFKKKGNTNMFDNELRICTALYLCAKRSNQIVRIEDIFWEINPGTHKRSKNYIVMEQGYGDLGQLMEIVGKFAEAEVRFYAAQMLLGLEYLHSNGVLYLAMRDRNLLFDRFGNTKFIDFENALMRGTPIDYKYGRHHVVPVARMENNASSDFWKMGYLLYRLVMGEKFKNDKGTDLKTIFGNRSVPVSNALKDLINKLMGGNDGKSVTIEELKQHQFFNYTEEEWKNISVLKVTPPYSPKLYKHKEDLWLPVKSSNGKPQFVRNASFGNDCRVEIVETIPSGMHFEGGNNAQQQPQDNTTTSSTTFKSTFESWVALLRMAQHSIDMNVFYWQLLTDVNAYPPAMKGAQIYEEIERAIKRGVQIRIVQSVPKPEQDETKKLAEKYPANVHVRIIDISKFIGVGYLHQKAWIVDGRHAYFGSANMDWGSFTDMAELGVQITNCEAVVNDLESVFLSYWSNGVDYRSVDTKWVTEERNSKQQQATTSAVVEVPKEDEKATTLSLPRALENAYNSDNPLQIKLNGIPSGVYVYVNNSPSAFNPKGREHTLSGIVHQLNRAERHIRISVRDILPMTIKHLRNGHSIFVPEIDNALRAAAIRGVRVELLVGIKVYKAIKKRNNWASEKQMNAFLRSLLIINEAFPEPRIFVKRLEVPQSEHSPHSRMTHMKYMPLSTFNWDSDSFFTVSGMGLCIERAESMEGNGAVNTNPIVDQLEKNFVRNWNSQYAKIFS